MRKGPALALGVGLAAGTIASLAATPKRYRAPVAAQVTTFVATGSYLLTALRSDDPVRRRREVASAAVGTLGAFATAAAAPRAMGPLLAAHGLYDLLVARVDPEVLPFENYAPFCAAYDIVTGVALVPLLAED